MQDYIKLILIFILLANVTFANTNDSTELVKPELSYTKLGIVAGLSVGGIVVGQITQQDKYWKEKSNFSVMPWKMEYDDALIADKFGHFFFANAFSQTYKNALLMTGLDTTTSLWIACGLTFSYHSYIELKDAYSKGGNYLSFSRGDIIANFAGVAFTYWQTKQPEANKFNFKYSLQKSENYNNWAYKSLTDDYESSYHWLAIDSRLIYDSGNDWQKYFNLAIGHSVKDLDRNGKGYHEVYLSLDYNLKEIETGIEFLDYLIKTINNYHLPAPAVRVYPDVRFYFLKM